MKYLIIFAVVLISLVKWTLVPNIFLLLFLFITALVFHTLSKRTSTICIFAAAIFLAMLVAALHVELYQHKTKIALSTNKNTFIRAKVISLSTGASLHHRVILEINEINGQVLNYKLRNIKLLICSVYHCIYW